MGQLVGSMWRNLTAKKKAEYNLMAEKDRERYQRELTAFHLTTPTKNIGKTPKAVKPAKDPYALKKPTSSYMFFNREMAPKLRAENNEITVRYRSPRP